MESPPPGRCGYTWPTDHDASDPPNHQSCCYRPAWRASDRCLLHAEVEGGKPVRELASIRADGVERTPAELLDGADLSNTNVADGLPFEDCSLRDADLSGARLVNADFTRANLARSDLGGCDLTRAALAGANCERTIARRAVLAKADLTDAAFVNGDLGESDLRDVTLAGADLTGVRMDASVLDGADLPGATVPNADLSAQSLENCDLSDADLEGTVFDRAVLDGADVSGATLANAELNRASLENADLHGAALGGATLRGAALSGADLSDADLESAELTDADVEKAYLDRANLFDAVLTDLRLYGATIAGAQVDRRTRFGPDAVPRCAYDPSNGRTDGGDYTKAAGTYRQLERLARRNSFPRLQSRMFVRRQDMQRKRYWEEGNVLRGSFAALSRVLFAYGESFWRIVGWSGALVVGFALLYTSQGWVDSFADGLFSSMFTFTTGGLAGFEPETTLARLLATTQAALGAILVATFVFVLGRRAAR